MIPTHLRHKREWDVDDFAAFLGGGTTHWQARERLKTYDREMHGMLLIKSRGRNRRYSFYPAQLAKAFPMLFDQIEGLGVRVDDLEEKIDDLFQRQRMLAGQTGHNTRDIARMKRTRCATA